RNRTSAPSRGGRTRWKSRGSCSPIGREHTGNLPGRIVPGRMLHRRFTEEHEAFRVSARRFVESELAPHALQWEREGHFPDWVFKRMGDLGLLGLRFPTEYGGQGGDWGHAIALAEEMGRCGSAGVAMAVAVQSEMATPPILKFGTEEQKRRYPVP